MWLRPLPESEGGVSGLARDLALVALGANLGDAMSTLREAARALAGLADGPVALSAFYTTEPERCPEGSPLFVNAAAAFVPRAGIVEAAALLRALHAIEVQLGRAPKRVLNEARVVDLDLVAWGGRVVHSAELVLPHPRAHLRGFVLVPLADVAPSFVLPGQAATVSTLARQPALRVGVRRCAT